VITAYEQYRAKGLADPEFSALYAQKRAEIDAIDTILSHIEERREELGLTKADLARLVGARPESVRRLLAARSSNPTLFTVMKLASVLRITIAGGRSWWAHFEFTRINITPTIEDWCCSHDALKRPLTLTCTRRVYRMRDVKAAMGEQKANMLRFRPCAADLRRLVR